MTTRTTGGMNLRSATGSGGVPQGTLADQLPRLGGLWPAEPASVVLHRRTLDPGLTGRTVRP